MKTILMFFLLSTQLVFAQLPPIPATTQDDVVSLINKSGVGSFTPDGLMKPDAKKGFIVEKTFKISCIKKSEYRADVCLSLLNVKKSSTAYTSLISKFETIGFLKESEMKWVFTNGPVVVSAEFTPYPPNLCDEPEFEKISVVYSYIDPDEPKKPEGMETIRLWD
jgi:hypothetical protein